MKKVLSVLLCMAMLIPLLGAAAPPDDVEETNVPLCESCQASGCVLEDGAVSHAEGCPCGQTPDGGEAGTCPCGCAACGQTDNSTDQPGDGTDADSEDEGNDATSDAGNENGKAGTTNDPSPANGTLPAADDRDFSVSGGKENVDYVYTAQDNVLTIKTGAPLTISGSMVGGTITAAPGINANITLNGLRITAASGSALDLFEAETATLTLEGANTLQGGTGGAGIRPPQNALTISGSGSLDASGGNGGAGIGGDAFDDGGTVTINGGTITARGGANAAGIGGGNGSNDAGSLTVNGGTVTAVGTPALGTAPRFGSSYIHLTYGATDAAESKTPVEWTGNPVADWSKWSSVAIQPMTVKSFSITPAKTSANAGSSVQFKAELNIEAGGKTSTLDVTTLTKWGVTGGINSPIDNTGKLTVESNETADTLTVSASYTAGKDYTGTATVTVLYPAASVKLDKTELKISVGDEATLKATVEPVNTYDKLTWSVDKTDIASIDQNGKITAVSPGTATVTAKAGNQTATAKVTVYSKKYTITFDPNGGKCDTKTAVTKDDGTLGSLPKATKEGMYFAHWYTAKEGGTRVYSDTVFDKDTTLYARWSTHPVTGDENNVLLWAVLLGCSALAIGVGTVYVFRKKRQGNGQ